MKKTKGLVRSVDQNGRITLPAEYVEALNLIHGKKLEIFSAKDKIIVRKSIYVNNRRQFRGGLRIFDCLGRIVIPSEIRKIFKIEVDSEMYISLARNSVVLEVLFDECIFCGDRNGLRNYNGSCICSSCVKNINTILN